MKSLAITLTALLIVLGISGCSSKLNQPNNYYTLSAIPTSAKAATTDNAVLKIDLPLAPSTLTGKRIIYQKSELESAYYAKNFWAEPLPSMMQAWMIRTIEAANLYSGVVRSDSRALTPLILESEIREFNHHLSSDSVTVTLHLRLIDTRHKSVLKNQTFSYTVPVKARNAQSAVEAFNAALKPFESALLEWLK